MINIKKIAHCIFICIILSFHGYAKVKGKLVTMHPVADDMVTGAISLKNSSISVAEFKCLTQTIYFEARGEDYKGRVAVGNVIMNRVKSPHFPNSICKVMKERTRNMCQFSFMCNGHIHKAIQPKSWAKSKEIAQQIMTGHAPNYAKDALFFHANYIKMRVAKNRYTAKIGHHYFYK